MYNLDLFPLCGYPKGEKLLETVSQIFCVFCVLALCSLSYGHTPPLNHTRKRPEGVQGLRQALSWLTEIHYQRGRRQESCSFFIPSVKLLTSNHSNTLSDDIKLALLFVGGMSHVSKLLVLLVDTGFQFYGTGSQKAGQGEQEICPAYLSQILHIYNNHLKWKTHSPSPDKFSSW